MLRKFVGNRVLLYLYDLQENNKMKQVKKIILLMAVIVSAGLTGCAPMIIQNIKTKEKVTLTKAQANTIKKMVANKKAYSPPFNKSPFMKDYVISGKGYSIEISSYNAKFRPLQGGEEFNKKTGEYFGCCGGEIKAILNTLPIKETVRPSSKNYTLLKIKSGAPKENQETIQGFSVIKKVELNQADMERMTSLIFDTSDSNLYASSVSGGISSAFFPRFAITNKEDGTEALICFNSYSIKFYKGEKIIKELLMNVHSQEFKNLKSILSNK